MELRHLRYFCAVADALNFSRAAERMRVAQPALSRQIKDLEEELGFQLLVRTTTRVQLTDAGRDFFASTQKLLAQLAIAITGAQEIAKGKGGDLNIASDWRIPMHLIPSTVRKFKGCNPKVSVNFADILITEQVEALRAGKIHLGFVPELALGAREDLGLLQIYTGRMMAIFPLSHRYADRESICLRELADERWVFTQDKGNTEFKSFMIQMCRPAGFTPIFGRSTGTAAGVLGLVAVGEGIALLPELVVPPDYGGLAVLPTDCEPMKMYAVWLKKSLSPLVDRYIEILAAEIKRLKPAPEVRRKRLRRPGGADDLTEAS